MPSGIEARARRAVASPVDVATRLAAASIKMRPDELQLPRPRLRDLERVDAASELRGGVLASGRVTTYSTQRWAYGTRPERVSNEL